MKILIVEDDKEINKILITYLMDNNYDVISVYDGKEASERGRKETFDLVLLDLMLPYKNGETVIKELRENSDIPIIVISAKSEKEAKLEALRIGADDYILKPFDLDEVLVRIEVVLRRSMPVSNDTKSDGDITIGELVVNAEHNTVSYNGKFINLTAKELQILTLLVQNPQKIFTKANLYEAVWNDTYYYEDNTINVHLSNLRSKLKKATGQDYVETVWGIGYRLKKLT